LQEEEIIAQSLLLKELNNAKRKKRVKINKKLSIFSKKIKKNKRNIIINYSCKSSKLKKKLYSKILITYLILRN